MHKTKKIDFYAILGVSKSATTEEIKKAYKKLAIKWHPDKNPGREKEAEEKFKEIAEAYSILTDPKKRQKYDMYGTADFDEDVGNGGFNSRFADFGFGMGGHRGGFGGFSFERAEQIFREAFGEEFGFSGFGRNNRQQERPNNNYNNNSNANNRSNKRGFFDDDDDFFMGGPRIGNILKNFGFGKDFFDGDDDDFFGGGFGGFGRGFDREFGRMQQLMAGGPKGGFSGPSKSVSQSTIIRNGKKVTVTKTTITNADGTSHTEVHEKVQDEGRTLKDNRYVDNGQFSRLEYNRPDGNYHNMKQIGYGNPQKRR